LISDTANILDSGAGANIHGTVHWMVPRAVNSLFTGRSDLLSRIQKALEIKSIYATPKQKRFVITGLGGQGKSEICLQVATLMKQQYVLTMAFKALYNISAYTIGSGEYSGSTSISLLPLRIILLLLQSCLASQSRVFPKHFKFLQLRIKAGSLFLIMRTIRSLITKPISLLGLTVPFS